MTKQERHIEVVVSGICADIQKEYGKGLLGEVYEEILCYELAKRDIPFSRHEPVDMIHDGVLMNISLEADIIIDGLILVLLKNKQQDEEDAKRIRTLLKLAKLKTGLMISFDENFEAGGMRKVTIEY